RISFFPLHCYLPLRTPHSFPTRRSSDLNDRHDRHRHSASGTFWNRPTSSDVGDSTAELLYQRVGESLSRWESVEHQFAMIFGRLDRKSTRLNSSHVKISYAVFCLKKKKK